ncbi:MAG: hypothetical protein KW793_02945 [Candidatus Doudnabacteria bacterium]|nr:hypothetical protein [Candidatus Doudnabacteria bacterium]
MDNFFQQDIFFFITTVSVIFLTLLLGVFLIYVIRIARTVDRILVRVREETDIITDELGELRKSIRKEGVKLKHFAKFVTNVKKKSN